MGDHRRIKLALFCTGGPGLGYGHLMRSASFAKGAPDAFQVRIFPLLEKESDVHLFSALEGKTEACQSEGEALQAISRFSPDVMVWDTVDCSDDFFARLKQRVHYHVSISPVFRHMAQLDALYTRNIETADIPGVKVFKGLEYAIFNGTCQPISDEAYLQSLAKPQLTVGISMGGSDAPNKTLRILRSISTLEIPMTIWVLLGEGYLHSYEELVKAIRQDGKHEIILAKTNRSMWDILSGCSLAILAGGLVMIEAVYAGLPSINLFEKELHQKTAGTRLFESGAAFSIGVISPENLARLNEMLVELHDKRSMLLKCREQTSGQIDKMAPYRIFLSLQEELKQQPSFSKQ